MRYERPFYVLIEEEAGRESQAPSPKFSLLFLLVINFSTLFSWVGHLHNPVYIFAFICFEMLGW
ncbi:uncharacterized protein DS421_11g328940 [Arachis hypogaea]|nr:uncharacterized protein DS421_11g328940 [Arachis hypogaea]